MAHPDEYRPIHPEGSYDEKLPDNYGLDEDQDDELLEAPVPITPDEVTQFIAERDARADELRGKGYHEDRIRADLNRSFRSRALELALRHGDFAETIFPSSMTRHGTTAYDDLSSWARNLQRRADADNENGERTRDWRERQSGDD